jgi:LPXTG-site transpeptidase (sortase) family protein
MKLSTANNILLGLIILVNGYIIVAPVLPQVSFWWQNRNGHKQEQLTQKIHPAAKAPAKVEPNQVIIPSMTLDEQIYEGPVRQQYATLDKGIWRWPSGSSPDKGGNTVLIGHRFTYTTPRGVLYFLDKVKLGDEIGMIWNNKTYRYTVSTIKTVPPTDTSIEDNTATAQLTIFTCTPLWLPKDRLVVVATRKLDD